MVNRGVVMVRPKPPYREWAKRLDASGMVPENDGERTVYLIPSFESDDEAWEILATVYSDIFEQELWSWRADPSAWPSNRSFAMFREWFAIEFHSVVEDLGDDVIMEEEED